MNLWEFKAGFYDQTRKFFPFNLILAKEKRNLKNLLSNINIGDGKILDAGTGTGTILTLLPDNTRLFAMDSSFKMLKRVKLKFDSNFFVGNANALPIKSDSLQLITAIGLLEYQKDKRSLLEEFKRVLAPSGYLLLTYSQTGFLNFMRFLTGHRIYFLSRGKFNCQIEENGLTRLKSTRSLIQRQILLQNNLTHG